MPRRGLSESENPRSPSEEDMGGATKGKIELAEILGRPNVRPCSGGLAHPRRSEAHDHPLTVKKVR